MIEKSDPRHPIRVHGRVNEGAHIAGYTLERAFGQLEWLLKDERWRECGFDDVNAFIASMRFDQFKLLAEQRRSLTRLIKAAQPQASNRAIGRMLGVDAETINRDQRAANAAPADGKPNKSNGSSAAAAANAALAPVSGETAIDEVREDLQTATDALKGVFAELDWLLTNERWRCLAPEAFQPVLEFFFLIDHRLERLDTLARRASTAAAPG